MPPLIALRNATVCTMAAGSEFEPLAHAAIVIEGEDIFWVGAERELPHLEIAQEVDCRGRLVTPGLIDCHTHLVYDGNRAHEFEMRLAGATYEEIARAGGGILSSVAATETEYTLQQDVANDLSCAICETQGDAARERVSTPNRRAEEKRFRDLIAQGVTTVEVKSGYGTRAETETFLLARAAEMANVLPLDVYRTYLAAHVMPPDAGMSRAEWVQHLVDDDVDRVYADTGFDAIDMFCEGIAFQPDELEPLLQKATELGVDIRIHADQLSDLNGAKLAADWHAASADHLEYTNETGAAAMAAAGTVAVLLPGAFYFIRETVKPPVDVFRKHGVQMAVATDHNPGTSPLNSLLLAANMAATLFGLTVEECLRGITINAAKALRRDGCVGSIEPGKRADLAIWDVLAPAELVYNIGGNPLWQRIYRGQFD
ncbi:MAG: imidazolonepropionase [Thermomicrobiales bacterium]|nr:imidazolonepropionase [Thermomicrobiales bacterium]